MRIWHLYNQAHKFSQSPGQIFGIRNRWLAYQFDQVVYLIGRDIENKDGEYKQDSEGKWVKVHDIRELLGLQPKIPPKLDTRALRDSPWVDVVRVPSSHQQATPSGSSAG